MGASVAWVNPSFALRIATFAMPTTAGGPDLAYSLENSHGGDQLEWELHPQILTGKRPNAIVRLLVFRNVAPMGRYRDALVLAAPGSAPDITQARRAARRSLALALIMSSDLPMISLVACLRGSGGMMAQPKVSLMRRPD